MHYALCIIQMGWMRSDDYQHYALLTNRTCDASTRLRPLAPRLIGIRRTYKKEIKKKNKWLRRKINFWILQTFTSSLFLNFCRFLLKLPWVVAPLEKFYFQIVQNVLLPTCCAMKRKGCCSHPGPLPKCPTRLKNHLLWEKNVSNTAEKEKWKYFQRKFSPVQVEKTRLLASLSSLRILIKDFTTASTLKNIFSFGICTILPIGKH